MNRLEFKADSDWVATRLTSRKQYVPKPSIGQGSIVPSRWHPGMIQIPGVEGFGVKIGKYKGESSLLLQLAIAHPFDDAVRSFCQKRLAAWNDTFNTWDIPVLSQIKRDALIEVWECLEMAFFELPWSSEVVELHWEYQVSDRSFAALQRRVECLNRLWDTPSEDIDISLVYPQISPQELIDKAYQSFKDMYPRSPWMPESEWAIKNLCVNHLRHKESPYHVLLKSDSKQSSTQIFTAINQAIAIHYPWLKDAAMRQIEIRQRRSVSA